MLRFRLQTVGTSGTNDSELSPAMIPESSAPFSGPVRNHSAAQKSEYRNRVTQGVRRVLPANAGETGRLRRLSA
jgi:hypothetical protein